MKELPTVYFREYISYKLLCRGNYKIDNEFNSVHLQHFTEIFIDGMS